MISNSELQRRWTAVRGVMRQQGIDWIIGAAGHPFGYLRWFTGRVGFSGTMFAFPAADSDILFAGHGDPSQHKFTPSFGVDELVMPAHPNLIVNTYAALLPERILATSPKRIGLLSLGYMPAAAYILLQKSFPNVELVDVSDQIAPIKAAKSEEEIGYARASAAMHDDMVALLPSLVRPGRTGRQIVTDVRYALEKAGSPAQTLMAGSAPAGHLCELYGPAERVLERGDQFAILIEAAGPEGYYTEAMPIVSLGPPSDGLRRAFDHVVEAQERVLAFAKPGALPNDLLRINDEFLQSKGYPKEGRLLGHSQGVDLVERPALTPMGDTVPLQANTVLALHPTVYAETACAYPINQIFLIRDGAPERMLKTPQEIIVV